MSPPVVDRGNMRVRNALTAILAAAGIAALACAGRTLANGAEGMAPLWLANVVVLAPLARWSDLPVRAVLSGAAIGLFIANLLTGSSAPLALVLAAANLIEIAAGLAIFAAIRDGTVPLHAPRNLAAFIIGPGLAAPIVSAAISASVLTAFHGANFAQVALHWFLANALGMIVVGPLVLAGGRADWRALWRSPRRIEAMGILLGTSIVTFTVFDQARYPALFLILPIVTVAVFRLHFIGAVIGIGVVAIISSIQSLRGFGPIAHALADPTERLLFLQTFLAVVVIAKLPVAAILAEREAMMRQVLERERQYRLLADHSNDMVVRIGLDGIRRFVSPASKTILGYEPEEMIGDTPVAAIHAEDRARVERVCRSLLEGALDPACTYRQRRRDGGYSWLEATYRLVRDDVGVPVEFIASVRDVGRLRRAEIESASTVARLEESHRLLHMAEGLAGVGHWRLDAITQELFWSDEVYRIHGRTIGDIPPLDQAIAVYHADDRAKVQGYVDTALRDGAPWTFRARLVQPGGAIRHVESSGQAERAPDGRIVGLVGVFRDITDEVAAADALIAARDEARASAEAKSAFLATMSHEIRTPMTGVLGMIELLRADLSAEDRERFFHNLEQSATLLMTVLDDILDFSKIESQNLILEHVDFNLSQLARNTLDLFHHAASTKGLLLSLSLPAGRDILVRGDPVRLQQVLSNLISNAVKFTMTGKVELRIEARPHGTKRQIRCEIVDTGVGIAPDAVKKLFEPFVQADPSTTRRFGGTGLGLAISRRLIEAMQGVIGVDSVEGHGTTFHVDVVLDEGTDVIAARSTPRTTPHRALSVLLAEDNQINRALVEALVRREGHAITSVANGRLAVEEAERAPFDVILMDMQMPELDGLAATRAIRNGAGPCATVPIIALTADASAERRRFYDNAGLTEFLTKPIDSDLLSERLRIVAASGDLRSRDAIVHERGEATLDEDVLGSIEQAIGIASTHRLLEMLKTELRERPRVIQRLIELDQREVIMAELHALKGATLNVGASRVGALAARIEEACETGAPLETLGHALVETARATRISLDEREKRRGTA